MIKHNQNGAVSGQLISLILAILLLIAAVVFGGWAFSSRQDYKNNTDQKIAAAVAVAKKQEAAVQAAHFAEVAKQPFLTYTGPEAFGSIVVKYPKTWSGYVDESGASSGGSTPVTGFFNPGIVPSSTDPNSVFALRLQVITQPYAQVLQSLSSLQANGQSRQGQLPTTITPYALPKLPKVVGVKVSGTLLTGKTGTMVVLPLRTDTLQISTDGNQSINDFNNYILPNVSFSP